MLPTTISCSPRARIRMADGGQRRLWREDFCHGTGCRDARKETKHRDSSRNDGVLALNSALPAEPCSHLVCLSCASSLLSPLRPQASASRMASPAELFGRERSLEMASIPHSLTFVIPPPPKLSTQSSHPLLSYQRFACACNPGTRLSHPQRLLLSLTNVPSDGVVRHHRHTGSRPIARTGRRTTQKHITHISKIVSSYRAIFVFLETFDQLHDMVPI
ncbi:hypothetical protein F5I97DRAFT_68577 [Phlebopus sp. FC_14]|nr:hypothetical protein F5I97DRAFT_68577 [Phlebopus sp. FC_14]